MDNTLYEINKHKFNVLSLSNKLINTYEINQEISINNEIKKETEFLLSLLNIKNSAMMNQMGMNNNMNFFNPMMNPNFVNNNNQFQQLIQQQLMQMQQMMQQPQINQQIKDKITVKFRNSRDQPISVRCSLNDSVSDIIKKYRKYSLDNIPNERFIFNAKVLSPSLTVGEAGLTNNCSIYVVETNGVRGG